MALKDLKLDLSKFRITKDPLADKKRENVNKKSDKTPLSSLADSAPNIPRPTSTPNKQGVEPKRFNSSERFLGETTPKKADNSENFLGETTPKKADNSENFLGETTPKKADNSENFLGETTPKPANNSEKFLGETTPKKADNSENFLGETTPSKADNSSNFLGETTPTLADNSENFLGETTPSKADNSSNFLGETTPIGFDNSENFLGETNTIRFNFNPNHDENGRDPKSVNYFEDIHAKGFTSNLSTSAKSQFIGVGNSQTIFNSENSRYSNIGDNEYTLGSTYSGEFEQAGALNSPNESFGLGKSHSKRQSPSFLDLQYDKFNLRRDSYNTSLGFKHPLILRGIQRDGVGKGEPQNWGIGGVTFDGGFIRGGVITSTVRAAVDFVRISKWAASAEGLIWNIKQIGLQKSNPNVELSPLSIRRRTKIFTPLNMLASVAGQHLGLHPNRHGITPLDLNDGSYGYVQREKKIVQSFLGDESLVAPKIGNRLSQLWKESFITNQYGMFSKTAEGFPFITLQGIGGINTAYGLIPNGRFPKRDVNTAPLQFPGILRIGKSITNKYGTDREIPLLSGIVPQDSEVNVERVENAPSSLKSKLRKEQDEFDSNQLNTDGKPHPLHELKGSAELIKNYETVAYSKLPNRFAGNGEFNDFRNELTDGTNKKIAESDNYKEFNVNKRVNFSSPGKISSTEDRATWWNTDKNTPGNTDRFDEINASEIGDEVRRDLVNLWFMADGGQRVQFRGTVSGINDSFTPSWESMNYNGRADSAYRYTTFERLVNFEFKVYATSRVEMKPIWKKLEYLSTMTMPQYGDGDSEFGYQGTLVRFRLGDLYNNKLAFIETLNYNMSDEVAWEISMAGSENLIGELPMGVDVSIGLKILDKVRPQLNAKVYDFNENFRA